MPHHPIKIGLVLLVSLMIAGCTAKTAERSNESPPRPSEEPKGGVEKVFTMTSTAFADGQTMPVKYASKGVSGGENISIPLSWTGAPEGTKSFAVAMVDRHPVAGNWVHWLVINIPADVTSLDEGASVNRMPAGTVELNNTFGERGYGGPQPPPGTGEHDYETTIYALDAEDLSLGSSTTLEQFISAIEGKTLGSAKLTGKFSR